MRIALKEWAVVVEALAQRRQILLLRKGGIAEGKRGFELKHPEFLFFPTWEHQQENLLRPEFRDLFRRLKPAQPEQLVLRHLGRVREVFRAPSSPDKLKHARQHHIWAEEYIDIRYRYRPDLPLYVVLVEVRELPEAALIPLDRRYAGCRSWVDLYQDVPIEEARPLVTEKDFAAQREKFIAALRDA